MSAALPDEAWAVALADLPDMGPRRLGAFLDRWRPPDAWEAVRAQRWTSDPAVVAAAGSGPATLAERWAACAAAVDVAARWDAHAAAEVGVAVRSAASYPPALAEDDDAPPLLFWRGDPAVLDGPRVAIVGTRRATSYGLDVAFELGRDLAAAGVRVVSGLALGIDGAAHAGALDAQAAPPVAVVGSGLDVVYPSEHGPLWRRVQQRGLVLSEVPLGVRPARWRFPARNRIIAALADAVVVVESRATGGSMHTVEEAIRRDRLLYAVPGPVRSPASVGTNRLLGEGALPLLGADDVLLGLGLTPGAGRGGGPDPRRPPGEDGAAVLDAIGWQPATVDQLALRTGMALGALVAALQELAAAGWAHDRGGWWERAARAERC